MKTLQFLTTGRVFLFFIVVVQFIPGKGHPANQSGWSPAYLFC
jgi:hypothetical protein